MLFAAFSYNNIKTKPMGKVKENVQSIIDTCDKMYQIGGSSAVIQHVNESNYEGVTFERCDPCESYMPSIAGQCLVCGQPVKAMSKPKSAEDVSLGKTIYRMAELRYLLEGLDDHDQVCVEACDEEGDVEDLYPMSIDVIDGIELTDGTIVREVRFCQRPNSEPDTRDKQPIVDALIDVLAEDIAKGDVTVLDELLLRMPYEILRHALPEDMWADFPYKK